MQEVRTEEEDSIFPVVIAHKCERIWHGDVLQAEYNYLDYEFETDEHRYRARTYLDTVCEVAVYGPFLKDTQYVTPAEGVVIDQRILDYLRRRFSVVKKLGPSGYELVD
jgi:hypothetical protein